MTRLDTPLLTALTAAGFALDSGPDSSGLWMKHLHRGGGGYYIDVGTSQLIADRKIKIRQGHGIKAINAHSLTLGNGEELEADEIVFATGYQNMRQTARKILGDNVADRVGDVWAFDEEGEWTCWVLVHGREFDAVSVFLEVVGVADFGCGGWGVEWCGRDEMR